jgi:hypothetical protein
MNTQELHELMHGEIDGANSAADSRRLHEFLQRNAEARRRYEELCETVAVLESVEMCEPSPELRRAILAAVQEAATTAPVNTGAEGGLLRRWGAVLKARPGYGYAFAAGLALGVVLLAAFGPQIGRIGSPSAEGLYGTVLPGAGSGETETRTMTIAQPGVTGGVRASFAAVRIVVLIELTSDGPVQVVLATDPGLACDSFRALQPGSQDLETRPGTTRLTHDGQGSYEITLEGAGAATSALTVSIRREGTLLGEEVLAPR